MKSCLPGTNGKANLAVFTKYRPTVDEYERVTVHGVNLGYTLCGKPVNGFRRAEPTHGLTDCKKCLSAYSKEA